MPGSSFSHPSPDILQDLKSFSLLRTDQNGWIELTNDGKQIWVEMEKLIK